MSVKNIQIDGLGPVKFYKRRSSRAIRLSVDDTGQVRVTLPTWVPYKMGVNFVNSKKTWAKEQQTTHKIELHDGQMIGKSHHLRLIPSRGPSITTHITQDEAIVSVPSNIEMTDRRVVEAAHRVTVRALKKQADALLLPRLKQLSVSHDFNYSSASTRQLKSRWGSCTAHKRITLNIFLIQLPWELIDYVILHELVHTKIMNHKADFWEEFSNYYENPKKYRKLLRQHKPVLF